MKKPKIKELLALEPGKHYIMKYNPANVTMETLHQISEYCREFNLFIYCLPVDDINQVQFETKEV